MQEKQSNSQVSRHSLKKTVALWKRSAELAWAQNEIHALVKQLEEAEAERDGIAQQLDCAVGHLRETVNYVDGSFAVAHDLGLAVELPEVLVTAAEFLQSHFEPHEKMFLGKESAEA